jgi:hypothetical protein
MSRDVIDRQLRELLQPCRSLPHHEVIAALLTISQRGLDDGRYSRGLVVAGLKIVAEALAEQDFSASDLVVLRTYLASLRMN